MPRASLPSPAAEALCLACGLCCDGTLFRDVEVADAAEAEAFTAAGLPVRTTAGKRRIPQPCPALGADCRCAVYALRPARCRQFECALRQAALAGRASVEAAHRTIAETRRLAERVRTLLAALGERRAGLPLSRRFAAVRRAFEGGAWDHDEPAVEAYAELTLAVQRLQRRLQADFHP